MKCKIILEGTLKQGQGDEPGYPHRTKIEKMMRDFGESGTHFGKIRGPVPTHPPHGNCETPSRHFLVFSFPNTDYLFPYTY
jgi:hypothetical protein